MNVPFWMRPLLETWTRWWFCLVALTLVLGSCGFMRSDDRQFTDALYRTLQLFVLNYGGEDEPGWELEIARWLAPLLAAFGLWRWAVLRLQRQLEQQALSNHVVICGLGRKGARFASRFRQMGYTVVAIEADEGNPRIDNCRNQAIRVLVGDATDEKVLAAARVEHADKVLCLCGDSLEREADVVNEQIASQAETRVQQSRPGTKGSLLCFIHARNLGWLDQRRSTTVSEESSRTQREYFNVCTTSASMLLEMPPCPFFSSTIAVSKRRHLIIVGLDETHACLVVEAARRWRRRLEWKNDHGYKLCLTIVDREADKKMGQLKQQYPQLDETCQFVTASLPSDAVVATDVAWCHFILQDLSELKAKQVDTESVAVIALPRDEHARQAAQTLELKTRKAGHTFPIILRINNSWPLEESFSPDERARIHVFRNYDETCIPSQLRGTVEIIARAIHEEYLHNRQHDPVYPEKLGDRPALQPWDQLSRHYQESNLGQARHMAKCLEISKFRQYRIVALKDLDEGSFTFPAADLEHIARCEHQRYLDSVGWRDPGHEANHSWELLNDKNKGRTREQVSAWPSILARIGLGLKL